VRRVAEGAAQLTGARLEILPAHPMYENVRPNAVLVKAARANAEAVGMPIDATPSGWNGGGASTDFGNVSQALPAYYLRFAVSQEPVPGHSTQMTEVAKSALAHDNAIATAKVLALTACDLLTNPTLLEAAREDFTVRAVSAHR
jgi:metal-dependent amidase/aminoacylase/carboxypeptidase family protein